MSQPMFNTFLSKLIPNGILDFGHYLSIHICKLAHLHINEFSLNLFLEKSRKPIKFKLNFVYSSIFNYHLGNSAAHFLGNDDARYIA